ncbi:hypothetical protein BDP27DRAFT_1227348, partial [Rhodocollybia butyracea]
WRPQTTILSLSCRIPFDKTTLIVVPIPSITLTSRTVHSSSDKYISRPLNLCCVRFTRSIIISGMTDPGKALVIIVKNRVRRIL